MAIVTLSREPGALGEEIAARVAGRLGFMLVGRARLAAIWREAGLDVSKTLVTGDQELATELAPVDPDTEVPTKPLQELIAQLAEVQDLVLIGCGGQGLFRGRPGTLHVRVVASRPFRIDQVRAHSGLSAREAGRRIREWELQRSRYVKSVYGVSWAAPSLYDLTLGMDRLSIDQAVHLIETAVESMDLRQVPGKLIVGYLHDEGGEPRGDSRFVNEAEQEFARFLDFYQIPYQYEPRTFPLETNAQGRIIEAFTPDFYLPEQDLFIELTTMKQSLVTRKNRKVRKLRQRYPDVNIRILYQRDYYSLLAKYGISAATGDETPKPPNR
ncbi:MAG: cytidylate kinase family protein [Syntrophobacteraceae bacterium]